MPSFRLVLFASFTVLGTLTSRAATLNFSFTAQRTNTLTFADASTQSCSDASGGTQYPLGCGEEDAPGARAATSIGGNGMVSNAQILTGPYTFQGSATASLFAQPGADATSASASYTFEALLSPVNSGDTFKFKLSDVNTCFNSLGACNSEKVLVHGASSMTGNLAKGETITATGPVKLDLTTYIRVNDFAPLASYWTEHAGSTLTIDPISETAPKPHNHIEAAALSDDVPVTTPEPGTLGLLGMTLVGFGLFGMRKINSFGSR